MDPSVATIPAPVAPRARLPQPSAVDRKIVLSRILAVAEARRLGLEPTADEVVAMTRWWRNEFGLLDLLSFAQWLRWSRMSLADFQQMMWDFAALTKVLEHHGAEIDARMTDHLRIHTVRAFMGEGRP